MSASANGSPDQETKVPHGSGNPLVFVIRMSAIGDVVMTARALSALNANGLEPVLVTSPGLADIARCLTPATAFLTIEGDTVRAYRKEESAPGGREVDLAELLAGRLDASSVLDLHVTSRSRRARGALVQALTAAGARAPSSFTKVSKRTVFRVLLVFWAWLRAIFLRQKTLPRERDFRPVHDVHDLQAAAVERHLGRLGRAPSALPSPLLSPLLATGHLFSGGPLLAAGKPLVAGAYVCLVPGASGFVKQWPKENFRALMASLFARGIDTIVVVGGKADRHLGTYLTLSPEFTGRDVRDVTGTLDLASTFRLLEHAQHVFTCDTFAAHVVDLTETPATVFFGATTPRFGFVPRSPRVALVYDALACSPCTRHGLSPCRFGNVLCLRGVTPERALKTLER